MDFLTIVAFFIVFLAIILPSLVIYARWNYGTLEAMGVPVVKPHWFLGSNYNYLELYHQWEDWARAKKLGLTYGVYNGRTPEIFTADPKLMHRMFFKESEYFAHKKEEDYGHVMVNQILEVINGDAWKLQHSILSPVFTSAKLKRTMQIVQKNCDAHVGELSQRAKSSDGRLKINFREFLPPFAIQVIAESLCGIQLTDPYSPDNAFVSRISKCLWGDFEFDWTWNWFQTFPFVTKLIPQVSYDHLGFFVEVIKDILDQREASGEKIQDTVDALLEIRKRCETEEFKKAGITPLSAYAQAYQFFSASNFGIMTAIEHMCYHLAMNPEVKKKTVEEVDRVLRKHDGVINHETLADLTYLSAALQETLRISTGFFRMDRVCTKDWDSGTGIRIKKGTTVYFPAYAVHHNPDNYPEPEKFKPERFLPENKDRLIPGTYLPFGQGHRQCLGMKLVTDMLKSFLVRLLRDFDVQQRHDTQWKELPGMHYYLRLAPIYLDLVSRKEVNK